MPTPRRRWARHDNLDETLVQAAVEGLKTRPLGTRERAAAVRLLAGEGMNDRQIAERLWWWRRADPSTVGVFRLRHGIPAGQPRGRTSAA